MARVLNCIYCLSSTHVDQGDHVVPARFGRFRDELRFLNICPDCNQRIGAAEEQLIRCTPETLALHDLQPQIQRKKRGIRNVGAAGAPPPGIWAELDGMPVLSHLSDTRPGSVEAHPQFVLIGKDGEKRSVRLHPSKPAATIRHEIDQHQRELSHPFEAHVYCPEDQVDRYSKLLRELGFSINWKATHPAGFTEATGVAHFKVTTAMFRAIAKIGFHYFLTQSTTYVGDEPAFAAVRKFILDGAGDPRAFFREYDVRRSTPNYGHALRAKEQGGRLLALVSLFCRAEITTGYEVRLGTMLLRPTWEAAHEYVYDRDSDPGFAGYVQPLL